MPLSRSLTLAAASLGGLGYLPWAPGTWGSLVGLPWWYATARLPWPWQVGAALALTVVAVAVASRAEVALGGHDSRHIVIDELAGMAWTAVGLPFAAREVGVGFLAFRLLDALKPPPIGWLDRRVGGGLGVVIDDVAAGLMAQAVTRLCLAWVG